MTLLARVAHASFVASVVVASTVALVACKPPKPGDACRGNETTCVDKSSALTCTSGKYRAESCRGPQGCKKEGNAVTCDDTLALEKDGCDEENEVACQVDKKAALECHGGTFVVGETCKGARGCTIDGEKITCDNDISDPGDPCHFDGDYACSADKKLALKCINHKMEKLNSCRGDKGCRVFELPAEKKIEFVCDDSLAEIGDPCDEEGEHACSMDKKTLYVCKSAKYALLKACSGPKGCSFDEKGEKFDCDTTSGAGKPVDVKETQPGAQPHKPAAPAKKK